MIMEQWKNNLAALVPFYDANGGNGTVIYTKEGKMEQDRRTVKWNLRRLARLYCIDLEAARHRYGEYLECGQGVPIPFTSTLVLVPLKVRRAVGKNDGSCGYFNPASVEVVPESASGGLRSALILPGGYRVPCYYTVRTVYKRLKAGGFVLERYSRVAVPVSLPLSGSADLYRDHKCLLERLILAVIHGMDTQE
jgi:hypothetical protein